MSRTCAFGNLPFTSAAIIAPCLSRTIAELEADIVALRAAAERAGTALACLFSSSDEFEAAVVRLRREQGAYRRHTAAPSAAHGGADRHVWPLVFLLI